MQAPFRPFIRRTALLSALCLLLTAQVCSGQRGLRLMSWNVENLFDTVHDQGFRDQEFLPAAPRRWTSRRYWRKLTDLSRVIATVAYEGALPALIGLCEVENDSVLTTLTQRSPLRNLGYRYVMTQSPDLRGIDVALLYQPGSFRLTESRCLRVPSREHGLRPTRDILYARGLILNASELDTLHVFVVHLPSKAGGYAGDRNRRLAAEVLWTAVDSVLALPAAATPKVVVMGDFNADGRDRLFSRAPLRLTDDARDPGTYSYQGIWQWLDHILVSSSLQTPAPASPVRLPWLIEENPGAGGQQPRRTYRGPTYHGGVSDHLALILDIRF